MILDQIMRQNAVVVSQDKQNSCSGRLPRLLSHKFIFVDTTLNLNRETTRDSHAQSDDSHVLSTGSWPHFASNGTAAPLSTSEFYIIGCLVLTEPCTLLGQKL